MGDENTEQAIQQFKYDRLYELKLDSVYKHYALASIRQHPDKELINTFVKLFHLWIFKPEDARAWSFAYLVPWFVILALFVIGLTKTYSWPRHRHAYLFIMYWNAIVVLFFALPRYQTMMKIALIPFAGCGAEVLMRYCQNKWGHYAFFKTKHIFRRRSPKSPSNYSPP
jgi:hypothetical protein